MGSDLGAALLKAKVVTNEQLEKAKKDKAEEERLKEIRERIERDRAEFVSRFPKNRLNQTPTLVLWMLAKNVPSGHEKMCSICGMKGKDLESTIQDKAREIAAQGIDKEDIETVAKLEAAKVAADKSFLLDVDFSTLDKIFRGKKLKACYHCAELAKKRVEGFLGGV